jgi:hypothetical protein
MKLIFERGPVIPNVESLAADAGICIVTFSTPTAAAVAHLATGWPFFSDDRSLAVVEEGGSIVIRPPQDTGAGERSFNSWRVAEERIPVTQ